MAPQCYADDSMILDMLMMSECAVPFATGYITSRTKAYITKAAIVGAIGFAYWRGRKTLSKEIGSIKEALNRVENVQEDHTCHFQTVEHRLGRVLKNQEEHTDNLHIIRASQRSMQNKMDAHDGFTKENFGILHTQNDATGKTLETIQQQVADIHKNQNEHGQLMHTILGEVTTHRDETRKSSITLGQGMYELLKNKISGNS